MQTRSSHNTLSADIAAALVLVNPNNVIQDLEQSVEVARINAEVDPSEESKERLRDLMFLLNFFRFRRLGG
jgi:hypothetical protein